MLRRACLGALRSTAACTSGVGSPMHTANASYKHSLLYFRRHSIEPRASCKLPTSRRSLKKIQHTALLHSCRASVSTPIVRDITGNDQKHVAKFVHSLSEEQAAAALAGDGHLRYKLLPFQQSSVCAQYSATMHHLCTLTKSPCLSFMPTVIPCTGPFCFAIAHANMQNMKSVNMHAKTPSSTPFRSFMSAAGS